VQYFSKNLNKRTTENNSFEGKGGDQRRKLDGERKERTETVKASPRRMSI